MKKFKLPLYFVTVIVLFITGCQKNITNETGTMKITFVNKVNGNPMVLNTKAYTNPFNETFTITKFKYYISNVSLGGSGNTTVLEKNSYHLVDESVPASLTFSFDAGVTTYAHLVFMLGVDSIRNVSGAQTGALDPLNDMFWTWNSGYIMAKIEGDSPQSNVVGNKIEYHIGGFSGPNNVLKTINLSFPADKQAIVKPGQTSEIIIEADLNTWWQTPNDIKIVDNPVSTFPGALSRKIADNYSKMFSIKDVINN